MKNSSELFSILRSNPVGFLKLYFKSNMNFESLDSWNPENDNSDTSLSLELFDGTNPLGSFIIDHDDIEGMDCLIDDDEPIPSQNIYGIRESMYPNSHSRLNITLYFPVQGGACGECYIYEYDDEESDKAEVKTISSLIDPSEVEKQRLAKVRRSWKYALITLAALVFVYVFSYILTHPK